MKAKKILVALGVTLAVSASAFAAKDHMWQYNQFTAIDMDSAKVSYDKGMTILTFETVESAGDSTDYCTYVYNVDDQTIQLKELISKTKKSKYKSTFYPESIANGNNVIKARARMANDVLAKVQHGVK
ncbi:MULTISPECIES: hypothetical protein [Megasphaera]|uniref:Uncharacterized protein n=1 Tax=Megasphaera vaginalis (ex Srinivasan et al. 2021) TaxID=1111454 RepID=U7UTD0_9FIRM|nr:MULTISPECIES: hypothetical protein [Megasphaera]ERT61703.1 hypothetical protein HMPREF1250_2173 [Megasphaera vaginalis (ex Srinivasan et al. 2021)]